MTALTKIASYRMYLYGDEYYRTYNGVWYLSYLQYDCPEPGKSKQIERIADDETSQQCEQFYQERCMLLSQLRAHWQPVANALQTVFTDRELLRLDSIHPFADSYSKMANSLPQAADK